MLRIFSAVVNSQASVNSLRSALADRVTMEFAAAVHEVKIVVLAIKPQQIKAVAEKLRSLDQDVLIISVLAATSVSKLRKYFLNHQILRAMPALTVATNAGFTPISTDSLTPEHQKSCEGLFEDLGGYFWTDDDGMPLLSMLNGSSPAFYLDYARQLAIAASTMGLDLPTAEKFAITGLKSAVMLLESGKSTQDTIDAISSKGGITRAYNESIRPELRALVEKGFAERNRQNDCSGKRRMIETKRFFASFFHQAWVANLSGPVRVHAYRSSTQCEI